MIDAKKLLSVSKLGACWTISSVLILSIIFPVSPARADDGEAWRLDIGGKSSIKAHLEERSIETKTKVDLGLETPGKLDLGLKLTREYETGGEGKWGTKFELKVPIALKENELEFYIKSALGETVDEKQKVGVETRLGGTDYDLGVLFEEGNKIGELEFSRWFSSGVSLKGKAELEECYIFKNSEIKFDGVGLQLKDTKWELSGEIKADPNSTPVLSSSVSLDNETEKEFSLSSPGGSQQIKGNLDREIEIDFKDHNFDELTFDWGVGFPWKDGEVHGDLKINQLAEIKKAVAGFRGNHLETKISFAEGKAGLTYYPPGTGEDFELELGFTINTKEELNSFLILEMDLGQLKTESAIAITSTKNDTGIELQQVIEW